MRLYVIFECLPCPPFSTKAGLIGEAAIKKDTSQCKEDVLLCRGREITPHFVPRVLWGEWLKREKPKHSVLFLLCPWYTKASFWHHRQSKNHLACGEMVFLLCRGREIRTPDPLLPKQVR